jgi:glucose-6-phosphate 1-dehydrogenase
MMQNHLLQLLCVTIMELDQHQRLDDAGQWLMERATAVLAELPHASSRYRNDDDSGHSAWAVRGQYESSGDYPGFRDEDRELQDSETETFVALRLAIDNDRWSGVPFFLRTGKRMQRRVGTVLVQFRNGARIVFRIQPNPQTVINVVAVDSPFATLTASSSVEDSDPYETILAECLEGRLRRGVSAEWIEASWKLVEAVRRSSSYSELHSYPALHNGPEAADELIRQTGRTWLGLEASGRGS